MGQLIAREKHPTQKHHGREKQGEVVGEKIIAFGQGVEDQCNGAEHDGGEQQNAPCQQHMGLLQEPHQRHHGKNGTHTEHRFEGRPKHLRHHDVFQENRCIQNTVPGALHRHARKHRIQGLKACRVHGTHANVATRDKVQISNSATGRLNLSHQGAQSIAKGRQPHEGLGNVAQQAGDGQFSPHQKIAHEHGPKPHHEPSRIWRPVSLRNKSSKFAGRCKTLSPG